MSDPATFSQRLRNGLARIETEAGGLWEGEALELLRRSVLMTLARLASKTATPPARFRFQFTGGKAILFQGNEALPLEPEKLFRLLNAMEITLQPGETIDLDGGMAAWLIRPEVTLVDSTLRDAEENLRALKTSGERDHGATQAADSTKIRLRSRLTQLISALQVAQKDPGSAPLPEIPLEAIDPPPPPPPPPPKVDRETTMRRLKPPALVEAPPAEPAPPPAPVGPSTEVLTTALRKIVGVIEKGGFKAAAIGDIGYLSWGSQAPVKRVELLISIGQTQQESLLSAARAEGLFPASGIGRLSLKLVDPKLGALVDVDLMQVTLAFHREVIGRSKPDFIYGIPVRVASCEDLIVLRAGSATPGHRESVIEMLRAAVNRLDASYLRRAAQTLGVMEPLKTAWLEAKKT